MARAFSKIPYLDFIRNEAKLSFPGFTGILPRVMILEQLVDRSDLESHRE